MKFICPKCQSEQDVEVFMDNVKASCVIDLTDPLELKYSYPELHESRNESYCCHKCGWKLPIKPHEIDDEERFSFEKLPPPKKFDIFSSLLVGCSCFFILSGTSLGFSSFFY